MKKEVLIILAAALLPFAACRQAEDAQAALKEALVEKIKAANPQLESFRISKVELKSKVLFKNELERRIDLMNSKVKAENSFLDKYKGYPKATEKHLKSLNTTEAIIRELELYRTANAAKADSLVYYVISFTGSGRTKDGASVPDTEMLATVSTENLVYNLIPAGGNPYKGMGRVLPGYDEILKKHRAEE